MSYYNRQGQPITLDEWINEAEALAGHDEWVAAVRAEDTGGAA